MSFFTSHFFIENYIYDTGSKDIYTCSYNKLCTDDPLWHGQGCSENDTCMHCERTNGSVRMLHAL